MNISREEYQEWRHHPVSKIFLQFMRDKQAFLKAAALEQWVDGSESFANCNQTIRGQIIELGEMSECPFEAISEFYKQEESNAAKDTVNQES
jgi:hypothetical protein